MPVPHKAIGCALQRAGSYSRQVALYLKHMLKVPLTVNGKRGACMKADGDRSHRNRPRSELPVLSEDGVTYKSETAECDRIKSINDLRYLQTF